MPTYSFFCESCNLLFEVKYPRDKAGHIPVCPKCDSKKFVHRDYLADNISVSEAPKTLGSLADKNEGKFSDDHKQHLKNKLDPKQQGKNNEN